MNCRAAPVPVVVEEHLGLARSRARRWHALHPDDAFGVASLALVEAARGFDPGLGFAFSTYAVQVIDTRLARAALREDLVPRPHGRHDLPRRTVVSIRPLDSEDGSEGHGAPEPAAPERDPAPGDLLDLHAALAELPAEERVAIELRFRLGDGDGRELSFAEVAGRLGVTRETARSRVRVGVELLRGAMLCPVAVPAPVTGGVPCSSRAG